jgi:tetratricopeptide (TPR) repeat protein
MTDHYDVFLSYARTDDDPDYTDPKKSFLRRLYTDLTDAGYTVWWDRVSMPSRALTFLQEIRDAITVCDKLILVVGPGALASDYVKAEWEYALSICLPVIPILWAGDYPLVPPALNKLHIPDFRDTRPYKDALDELKRILAEPAAPLGPLHGVPPLPQWYIRRSDDLGALVQAICADSRQPVVITSKKQTIALQGMGGIGKTVLASALCRECDVRRNFPDGVFWIEAGKEPQIATRLGDIGHAFGDNRAEYPDEQRGRSRLTALLEGKAVLIVLDDVWDHRHVEAFRVVGPRGRLVITTRNGRLVTRVGAVSQPVDTLTTDEGRALVADQVGVPVADLPPECAAIVDLLGGHTLAVSIAAAQLSERGLDFAPNLLSRLQKRLGGDTPFKGLVMSDDDKNLNLELSLSLSYDDLTPDLQRRFRLTGVFAPGGTFDRAAVMAIWEDADEDDADDALNDLVRAGLVEAQAGRYRQHALLRAYARALLYRAGELDDAQRRHFEHFAALYGDYDANNDEDRHPAIQADFEDLREALAWGWEHDPTRAVDLVWALTYYMGLRESLETRRLLLTAAYQAAERSGYRLGQANTLKALGDVAYMQDEYAAARGYYDRALPVYEQIGARLGQANTLKALGDVAYMQDEYAAARGYYDRALPVYEQIGARLGQANTLKALGDVAYMQDEYAAARGYYDRALPVYEQIGDRLGQANTLKALGDVALRENEYAAARGYYDRALPVYEQIGDRLGQANTLKALGDVALRENEYAAARGYYDRALPVYEQIGARLGQANTLKALGDVAYMQDEYAAARGYYDRALPVYEQIGDRLGQANTLKALGDVALRENEYAAARGYYDRALPSTSRSGTGWGRPIRCRRWAMWRCVKMSTRRRGATTTGRCPSTSRSGTGWGRPIR